MVTKTNEAKKTAKNASTKATPAEDVFADTMNAAKDQWGKMLGNNDVVADFQKENIEALTASAALANDSFEKITNESVAYQQKAVEDGMAIAGEALKAGSLQEALEIQANFAKAAVESYVGHMTKLGEMWSAGTQSALKPLSDRAGVVVQSAQNFRG